jgi:hypothetical protein
MTIAVAQPPSLVAPPGCLAVAALARAEARHLLRSPFLAGGVLLATALGAVLSWTRMPIWDEASETAGTCTLVLAAALLLATHLAAGRDHRAGAGEATGSMPATRVRRRLGLIVAVPIAGLSGALVYALLLAVLLPARPVGRFDPWAALAVVVIPAIGAALGLLTGWLLPNAVTGPLAVLATALALSATSVLGTGPASYGEQLWPVPAVPWEVGAGRPTGWHLLYLVMVLAAVLTAATGRSWVKSSAVVLVAVLLAAGFTVQRQVGAQPQVIFDSMEERYTGPGVLTCQTHRDVRYCALPRFTGWIPAWRAAVEPVAALLPATAARPTVRQIGGADNRKPMVPGRPEMVTSTRWGRVGAWAQDSRTGMARSWAAAAVGLGDRDIDIDGCDGSGQHRAVVGLWLLATTQPDGAARVARGELRLPYIRLGAADRQAVTALLARPPAEITAYLGEHWSQVLDPAGTALAGLGVTIRPPAGPSGGICR